MKMKMFTTVSLLCSIILLSAFSGNVFCGEKPIIKAGDWFPKIVLKPPVDSKDLAYLGVSGESPFLVSDVKADLLLVEVMNINCGHCQQQAPIYNKLFSLIESSPETRGRVKMMAVASGNSDKYIQQFRDHFKVPYPIIEDPGLEAFDAFGKPGIPFVIYVRPLLEGNPGVVAGTHVGFLEDFEAQFTEMKALMEKDLALIVKAGDVGEKPAPAVAPLLTEDELIEKIRSAFPFTGQPDKIDLDRFGMVYSFMSEDHGRSIRLFAKYVGEPLPCDQCHDAHFIYLFDEAGKIRSLIPISLSKYGNKKFDDRDIREIQERLSGSRIQEPMQFDAEVDAVTGATITSVMIFKNVYDNSALLDALTAKGWIKTP